MCIRDSYKRYENSLATALQYDNTILVKTSEIGEEPQKVLDKVQSFLNVEAEDIIAAKINSSNVKHKDRELRLEDRLWYNIFSSEKDVQVNFLEWLVSPFVLLFSLLKLPKWLFGAYRSIKITGAMNPISYLFGALMRSFKSKASA